MLRTVATVLVTLVVAFTASFGLLQIDIALHPDVAEDRAFGLAVVGTFDLAIYAWLYAIAVGFAVVKTFAISGWRKIAAATFLLAVPPLLVEGVSVYLLYDGSVARALDYLAEVLIIPFVASLAVSIAGMTPNTSLERTRER
jgi:hypothetical protein